jgi:hypothetical protein
MQTRFQPWRRDSSGNLGPGFGRGFVVGAACLLLLSGAAFPADGGGPIAGAEPLTCKAVNGGVLLEWNFAFFAPIEGYLLSRDKVVIASLPPDATSYFDQRVEAGPHVYLLQAINFTGDIGDLATCEVTVGDSGLRCKPDGNLVYLEWGPILIDVLILRFEIIRNGELIAVVPPRQLSYVDRVPTVGSYRYAVHAVVSEDSKFLVGTCTVEVQCFGLTALVRGLEVLLNWGLTSTDPPITPDAVFYVHRDGQLIAKTTEGTYTDTVPAPGEYLYEVYLDLGTGGVRILLVGACLVAVPGVSIPPPTDLKCIVLSVDPGPVPLPEDPTNTGGSTGIDSDGDGVVDSFPPAAVVLLEWVNPILYDKIVIHRNDGVIATIPGDQSSYVDRVHWGGTFVYAVFGVLGNVRSRAAKCEVEVPPVFVPPPQDFTCVLLDILMDPTDPDNPRSDVVGEGNSVAPFDVVLLKWWNPVRYESLVILRDREILAELPGDAMMYRDVAPPAGEHVYGIYGIVADGRRSPTAVCWIVVGPEPVPPVTNLVCRPEQFEPQDDTTTGAMAVLTWTNAAKYDAIEIVRNDGIGVSLPGDAESYVDSGLEPGVYIYQVIAVLGGNKSPPVTCQVVIMGPPTRNLLYFDSGIVPVPDPAGVEPEPTPLPGGVRSAGEASGNVITCLADNADEVQGWSFGVASDPKFIVPKETSLEGTITETFNEGKGPDFLILDILADGTGVVMAAIISQTEPFEMLPPGMGHSLLHIAYGPGPSGMPGQLYPVRYADTLGSPPVQVLFVVKGFEVIPRTLPGWVTVGGPIFIRGDANADGSADISDAVTVLSWLFMGGKEPGCLEAADINRSGAVNIADPVYLLNFKFLGGPAPPHPYPDCGRAAAPLGCKEHEFCGWPPNADVAP